MSTFETALSHSDDGRTLVGKGSVRPQAAASPQEIHVGQTLAQIELEEIVAKTKRWAETGRLNRGLRLSLPYFDDQAAEMKWLDLDIIPTGRIMFVPAFVVLAVHREALRIRNLSGLTERTRTHLLGLLRSLQQAFGPVPPEYLF